MGGTEAFLRELRDLLGTGFTGAVTLHVHHGAVKQYEVNETRRPKTQHVDLTEANGETSDSDPLTKP